MIRARHTVKAPSETVWRLLTDTQTWPSWGLTVRVVDCADRIIRLGSTGRIWPPLGPALPFRITAFEPGHRWRWTVGGIPATDHWVIAQGPDRTLLVFGVPLWAAGYVSICHVAARRLGRLAERHT